MAIVKGFYKALRKEGIRKNDWKYRQLDLFAATAEYETNIERERYEKKKMSKDYIQDLANEIFMKLRGLIKENDELIDTAKKSCNR